MSMESNLGNVSEVLTVASGGNTVALDFTVWPIFVIDGTITQGDADSSGTNIKGE